MKTAVDLTPEAADAVGRAVALHLGHAPTLRVAMTHVPPAMTVKQAVAYTGRSRSTVFEFMATNTESTVVDALGTRRVRTAWLDAWVMGNLEALKRAHREGRAA